MPEANMSMNSLNCIYNGLTHIHLHNPTRNNNNNNYRLNSNNGQTDKYVFVFPNFQIHNTAFGERYFNYSHKAFLVHSESNLILEVLYAEKGMNTGYFSKKVQFIDQIQGGIYEVKPEVIDRLLNVKYIFMNQNRKKNTNEFIIDHQKDVVVYQVELKGIWSQYLDFNEKRYWDINVDRPYQYHYDKNVLPSNSFYRQDVNIFTLFIIQLLALKMGDTQQSQEQKEILEQRQRNDKKLRVQQQKNRKNKNKK